MREIKNPTPLDLRISRALKFWRTFDRRTMADVARTMGTFRTAYTKTERYSASPRLETFLRLADALYVSPYILALTVEAFE